MRYGPQRFETCKRYVPLNDQLTGVLYSEKHQIWKLTDFGTTKQGSLRPSITHLRMGTVSYCSPEVAVADRGHYVLGSDIWSLGCIFWRILNDDDCFPDPRSITEYIRDYRRAVRNLDSDGWERLSFKECISGPYLQFLPVFDNMLAILPNDRPQANQLKRVFGFLCQSTT